MSKPMWESCKRVIIGVGHNPAFVARARALALYAIPLLIAAGVAWAADWTDPRLLALAPAWCIAVRAIGEALIDELNKPSMNDIDPPAVAGGGDASLLPPPPGNP